MSSSYANCLMKSDPVADKQSDVLLDSSAAIALILVDHDAHTAALSALAGRRLGLAGHAWFETFSVLTRLPRGMRRSPADAYRLLRENFPESRFLDEMAAADLGAELAALGISGGSVYDALVGAVARQHGLPLVSADTRARPIYEALAVEVEWVAR